MAARPPRAGSSAENPSNPPQDLYPTSDIRFVLVRIGELGTQVQRLIDDVGEQSKTLTDLSHKVSFVKGAVWVLGGLIVVLGILMTLYMNGKLLVIINPSDGHP